MRRRTRWIKLDVDWREDPKVLLYQERHGKAALVDLIDVFCLMGEFEGVLNLNDDAQRLYAQRRLGRKERAMRTLLDGMAECGLISATELEAHGYVCSERSRRDGEHRHNKAVAAQTAREAKEAKKSAAATETG